jgi:hypothetical protein
VVVGGTVVLVVVGGTVVLVVDVEVDVVVSATLVVAATVDVVEAVVSGADAEPPHAPTSSARRTIEACLFMTEGWHIRPTTVGGSCSHR